MKSYKKNEKRTGIRDENNAKMTHEAIPDLRRIASQLIDSIQPTTTTK